MTIGLYGSRRQNNVIELIEQFLNELLSKKIDVVMHRKLYTHITQELGRPLAPQIRVVADDNFEADLVVSLGGDGTFLRAAAWVGEKEIPIVGVNTGHLGYLTALPIERLPSLPQMIENDCFLIERRSLIEVTEPNLPFSRFALNEVTVFKEASASMIRAHVEINGITLADYHADGLIISTPTGSTAYNLSAGGPIVQPTLDVVVITPLAPHSLSMRPLVADSSGCITVVPTGRAPGVRLALDGRSVEIPAGTPIRLTRAPFNTLVMQLASHPFTQALREKLHWGEA